MRSQHCGVAYAAFFVKGDDVHTPMSEPFQICVDVDGVEVAHRDANFIGGVDDLVFSAQVVAKGFLCVVSFLTHEDELQAIAGVSVGSASEEERERFRALVVIEHTNYRTLLSEHNGNTHTAKNRQTMQKKRDRSIDVRRNASIQHQKTHPSNIKERPPC